MHYRIFAGFFLTLLNQSVLFASASPLVPRHRTDTTYNQYGEMLSNGRILESRYDAFGQLVYARTSTHEQFYGYDGQGKRTYQKSVELSTNQAGTSLYPSLSYVVEPTEESSFTLLASKRLARIDHRRKAWFYYLKDQLESSDYLMTPQGRPVEQALYRPFGQELNPLLQDERWQSWVEQDLAAIPNERMHHRFTDQYLDDGTGLQYFNARYYDPASGTFISPDRYFTETLEECLASPIECNLYTYVGNNPLNYVDPTGMYQQDVHQDLTKFVAENLGVEDKIAQDMGVQTQAVDKRPETNPLGGSMFTPAGKQMRADYHFTTAERRRDMWLTAIKSYLNTGNLKEFGQYLHAFQDSYSHEGYGSGVGHLFSGTRPDRPENDPMKSKMMVVGTIAEIKKFIEITSIGNINNNHLSPEAWKKIDAFIFTGDNKFIVNSLEITPKSERR